MSRSSCTLRTTEFTGTISVKSPMRTLPDGVTTLPSGQRANDLLSRHPIGAQPIRIHAHDDRSLVAAERRRRGHAGQRREHRTDAIQGEVLDLAERARLTRKDEIAHGHAAGVETHDERRHRAGRHERTGAVHVSRRSRPSPGSCRCLRGRTASSASRPESICDSTCSMPVM